MENILITGSSGNVGGATLQFLQPRPDQKVYTTTRDSTKVNGDTVYFDFGDPANSAASLKNMSILVLIRPPALANVDRYFSPVVRSCQEFGVKHIIFLSVQGADTMSFIPHAKIERLIISSGISYTFIRPSYFMQNLTTILSADIRKHREIFLPAGRARFLWVDVADIGKAVARLILSGVEHSGRIYTITGSDLCSFQEVTQMISTVTGKKIEFVNPSPVRFGFRKHREGMSTGEIFVMVMLHMLPRFQKVPKISHDFFNLVGSHPNRLQNFIELHRASWD